MFDHTVTSVKNKPSFISLSHISIKWYRLYTLFQLLAATMTKKAASNKFIVFPHSPQRSKSSERYALEMGTEQEGKK